MKRKPWTFLIGFFAVLVFYCTVGIVVLYFVINSVGAATGQTFTIFDYWYQTLIFVLDIISVLCLGGSIFMKVKSKKEEVHNEK